MNFKFWEKPQPAEKRDYLDEEIRIWEARLMHADPDIDANAYSKIQENLEILYELKSKKLKTEPDPEKSWIEKYGNIAGTLIAGGVTLLCTILTLRNKEPMDQTQQRANQKISLPKLF